MKTEVGKVFGLLAHPAGHSLSPVMHNAAFRHLGLDHYYQAFDVPPAQLSTALEGIRALGIGGVNVTIPHKEAVIPYLDEVEAEAQVIGAVNTIVLEANGCLRGYNTDGAGYVHSLLAETKVDLTSARTLLLGAGGAAKGIGIYLLKAGCRHITLANRTAARAVELSEQLRAYLVQQAIEAEVHTLAWTEAQQTIQDFTLLINTTPKGMWPNISETPFPLQNIRGGTIVSDIVYNPLKTKFLQEAEVQGAFIHQGLGMFIYQGALAFKLFTGYEAPIEIMKRSVLERLQQGGN